MEPVVRLTADDLARRNRLQRAIDLCDAERGRPLTALEQLCNLVSGLSECDTDCASRKGGNCNCGGAQFSANWKRHGY